MTSRVPCDGTAATMNSVSRERLLEVGGDAQPIGKRDVRQVDGVRAPRAHVGHERGIARPQARVVTDAREVHGERRAPAAGSENRDVTNGSLHE